MSQIYNEIDQEQIIQFFAGYHATRAISLGISIGLFEELNKHEGGIYCEQLASRLNLSPKPLEELCALSCKLGLIANDNGKLKISPKTSQIISEIGGHAAYCMATAQEFREYEKVLRTGQPMNVESRNDSYIHAISLALKRTYDFLAKNILPQAEGTYQKLCHGASCLEIGCGEGYCISNLAKIYPKSIFTGVDIEEKAVRKARELIKNEKMNARVSFTLELDTALEDSFVFIYTMSSLHEFKDPVKVLEKYKRYLRKDGTLIVADFIKPLSDGALSTPLEKVVHGLFFDEVMQGTPYLDEKQILRVIEDAGYCNITRINTTPLAYIAAYSCNRGETNGR